MDKDMALLSITIREATDGDNEAAKDLMKLLCEHLKSGTVPPTPLRLYFYRAFMHTLGSDSPDKELHKALHLNKRRGKPGGANSERDWQITREVLDVMNAGKTRDDAIAQITDKYHLSESEILKIYDKHKRAVKADRALEADRANEVLGRTADPD